MKITIPFQKYHQFFWSNGKLYGSYRKFIISIENRCVNNLAKKTVDNVSFLLLMHRVSFQLGCTFFKRAGTKAQSRGQMEEAQKPITVKSPSYGEFNFTRLVRFSGLYIWSKKREIAVKIQRDALQQNATLMTFYCTFFVLGFIGHSGQVCVEILVVENPETQLTFSDAWLKF